MKRKLKDVASKRRASMSLGAARLFLAGISFEDATAAWPVAPAASAEAQPASTSAPLALSAAPEASSAPSPTASARSPASWPPSSTATTAWSPT